ncbi:hypothetical protein I6B53_10805 [Schaalia sp. 19OD2882]|uniref:DUF4190 domain-containing protein n=1 Tax=Schaalia sp. 19OD2882 TaxID=2794089 RepID=UPI001C1EF72D|nr:DUF4190 domain-containing protein [Schaalia sp. 19OD2882]QWW19546.1 hypothetical protein I6B53_10805 [Schaalia sp. 19OD2882]
MSTPYSPSFPEQPNTGQQPTGVDPYGQTSAPQPTYGQPAYDQTGYGQPAYGQPVYDQTGYGVPSAGPAEAETLRSNATAAMILGILGLVLIGWLGSIPAWVWGNSILKKAQAAGIPESYVSNAKIAKITGIIGVVLGVIAFVFVVFFVGLGVLAALLQSSQI